jgi:hypothetical protein
MVDLKTMAEEQCTLLSDPQASITLEIEDMLKECPRQSVGDWVILLCTKSNISEQRFNSSSGY